MTSPASSPEDSDEGESDLPPDAGFFLSEATADALALVGMTAERQ